MKKSNKIALKIMQMRFKLLYIFLFYICSFVNMQNNYCFYYKFSPWG